MSFYEGLELTLFSSFLIMVVLDRMRTLFNLIYNEEGLTEVMKEDGIIRETRTFINDAENDWHCITVQNIHF